VRRLFTREEFRTELGHIDRDHAAAQAALPEDDDVFAAESPQQRQRFAVISELLIAPALGTS
jgi:hypothetical protein